MGMRVALRRMAGRLAIGSVIAMLLIMPSATSIAATATSDFLVSATVLDVCSVDTTSLAFGDYSATSATPLDSTSTVTATCTSGLSYTIALNEGTTSGSTVDNRSMTDGTNTLQYDLYSDSSHSTMWGDGTSGTSTISPYTGNGSGQAYTVYGRIPANQYVVSGSYTDTVTATVTY